MINNFDDENNKELDEKSDAEKALEIEFSKVCQTITPQIKEKIDLAAKLIEEAEGLSEKHGIPFRAKVSFIYNSYIPQSLDKKFPDIDDEFVSEETGVYKFEYGGGGWQHSAVC